MKIEQISTNDAPPVVGPYSVAIKYADLIFCSGQIGLNPETKEMVEGIEAQTEQVLKNLEAALTASGSDFAHVLKTTIYLADMNDYAAVNDIYGKIFNEYKPARATVQVAALPRNALIEIDAIAAVNIEGMEELEGYECINCDDEGGCVGDCHTEHKHHPPHHEHHKEHAHQHNEEHQH